MKKKQNFFGYSPFEVSRLTGISYTDVWRHANGKRKISAEFAMRYHTALGIPLWMMRPDLWPEEPEAGELRQVQES